MVTTLYDYFTKIDDSKLKKFCQVLGCLTFFFNIRIPDFIFYKYSVKFICFTITFDIEIELWNYSYDAIQSKSSSYDLVLKVSIWFLS